MHMRGRRGAAAWNRDAVPLRAYRLLAPIGCMSPPRRCSRRACGRNKPLTLSVYVLPCAAALRVDSCGAPPAAMQPSSPRFFAWQTKTATMRKRSRRDSAISSSKSHVPVAILRPPSPRQQALYGCVQAWRRCRARACTRSCTFSCACTNVSRASVHACACASSRALGESGAHASMRVYACTQRRLRACTHRVWLCERTRSLHWHLSVRPRLPPSTSDPGHRPRRDEGGRYKRKIDEMLTSEGSRLLVDIADLRSFDAEMCNKVMNAPAAYPRTCQHS